MTGGTALPRWHVLISRDDGEVSSYLVTAPGELVAAAKAGAQHDDDDSEGISDVTVEPWDDGGPYAGPGPGGSL